MLELELDWSTPDFLNIIRILFVDQSGMFIIKNQKIIFRIKLPNWFTIQNLKNVSFNLLLGWRLINILPPVITEYFKLELTQPHNILYSTVR